MDHGIELGGEARVEVAPGAFGIGSIDDADGALQVSRLETHRSPSRLAIRVLTIHDLFHLVEPAAVVVPRQLAPSSSNVYEGLSPLVEASG